MTAPTPESVREAIAMCKECGHSECDDMMEQADEILRALWEACEAAGQYQRARFEALGKAVECADELYKEKP